MFYKHRIPFLLILLSLNSIIFSEGFIAGTLVKAKDRYVPIELIKPDDTVLTYNFKNKNIEEGKVKSVKVNHYSSCISLIANNTEILVSPDHRFYCPMNKKRWTLAKDIKSGDYILRNIKDLIKIDNAAEIKSENNFYCLSIENNHNYFMSSQDILVHNFVIAIPIFTWIIGEGLIWAGLGTWAAAVTAVVINEIAKKNGVDCSGLDKIGDIKLNFDEDPNKIHHMINKPGHGFLASCNAGGPDEDPDEWIKRIKKTVDKANKNPDKYPDGKKVDIPTKWKSADSRYGELIVRVFKVNGMMELSTAFLKQIKK